MKHAILASTLILPLSVGGAWAAGGGDEKAPSKPKCEAGQVYDKATKACVVVKDSHLDTEGLYENLRELAYAGRYDDAREVLALMPAADDRTQTYRGFIARKTGDMDGAMRYYRTALRINPDTILARSYMGQGLVAEGRVAEAIAQLREIRARGGNGTWAEASLRNAIATGRASDY